MPTQPQRHTPGPWFCQKSISEPGRYVIKPVPGQVVAITDPANTKAQEKANASLIAAAPDLLVALESVERWMSGYGTKSQSEMRQVVRAAIAAATGEGE